MKRLIFISLFLVLFFFSVMADAANISGKVFVTQGCTVSFVQGPFGPGEGGTVTITCGQDICRMNYTYQEPVLMVYDDVTTLKFAYTDYALWYMDPGGLVLTEQK